MKFSEIFFVFCVFSFVPLEVQSHSHEYFGFGGFCGYQCTGTFACIPLYEICNGIWNCPAGDDEINANCLNPFLTGFGRSPFGYPVVYGTGIGSQSFTGSQSSAFAGTAAQSSSQTFAGSSAQSLAGTAAQSSVFDGTCKSDFIKKILTKKFLSNFHVDFNLFRFSFVKTGSDFEPTVVSMFSIEIYYC